MPGIARVRVQEANSYMSPFKIEGWMYGEKCFEQKEQHVQRHRGLKEWKLPTVCSMIRVWRTGARLRKAFYDAIDFNILSGAS